MTSYSADSLKINMIRTSCFKNSLISQHNNNMENMSEILQKNPQVVLCDMCTEDDRKPARKTCMKCEISMCVEHLQAHQTTPVLLQTHPLTEPIASGEGGLAGTTKCPQHGKLLEYYCLDDLTCVCVSCAIEDQHRLHNMKTFSTAHKELREKVTAELLALDVRTDGENVSLEKWEKHEREELGRSSDCLIQAVTNLRDLALTSVQSSVSARMVCLKTSKSSLQAAKAEEDTFRFLQMYSQVHKDLEKAKSVNLKRGLEPGNDCNKMIQEIRQSGEEMLEKADNIWGSLLTHVDPESHQQLTEFSSDLFFKPKFFSPVLSLSKDNRTVYCSGQLGNSILLIQSTLKSTAPDICRWGVSFPSSCNWAIGLCDKNFRMLLKDRDVYGLCLIGGQLSSLKIKRPSKVQQTKRPKHDTKLKVVYEDSEYNETVHHAKRYKRDTERKVSLEEIDPPQDMEEQMGCLEQVEVEWSVPDSLSFYDVTRRHQRRKIITLPISSTNQCLTPFVCLENKQTYMDEDRGPSLFSTDQHMQQWKCSCGTVHPGNSYAYGGIHSGGFCNSEKDSVPRITEVLCELL